MSIKYPHLLGDKKSFKKAKLFWKYLLIFRKNRGIIYRLCKKRWNLICTVCIKERYLAYGEDSLTLRLVSKLPDLRVANAKWIQWASSLSLVSSSSINMMHTGASYLWRDIEVVITGLTRKVAELITWWVAKAREFFDYLANASFFLNFGWQHFNFGLAKAVQNSNNLIYAEISKWS